MPKRTSFAQLIVATFLLGCSGSDSTTSTDAKDNVGGPSTDTGGGGSAAPPAPDPSSSAPKPPDLDPGDKGKSVPDALAKRVEGTYAMRMRVATTQDLPVLGKSPSTSVSYGVVVIARDGNGLSLTDEGCHVDIEGSASVTTTVPDAIAESVPPTPRSFRVWEEGGAIKWARPLAVVPVGVKLGDPANDPLPKEASDSRVWDQDKDGTPGVTVKLSGFASGDIYVIQKQANVIAGELDASGDLKGLVVDTSEQVTIGASNSILNRNIPTTPDPDASKSNIVFVKQSAGLTCQDLMAKHKQIFDGK